MSDYTPETLMALVKEVYAGADDPIVDADKAAYYAHTDAWKAQRAASQERVRRAEQRAGLAEIALRVAGIPLPPDPEAASEPPGEEQG